MVNNELDTVLLISSSTRRINEVRGRATDNDAVIDRVPISKLSEQISKLTSVISSAGIFEKNDADFLVDEIKISAEVTAEGEIGIIVAGSSISAKGAIEITFRRKAVSHE